MVSWGPIKLFSKNYTCTATDETNQEKFLYARGEENAPLRWWKIWSMYAINSNRQFGPVWFDVVDERGVTRLIVGPLCLMPQGDKNSTVNSEVGIAFPGALVVRGRGVGAHFFQIKNGDEISVRFWGQEGHE